MRYVSLSLTGLISAWRRGEASSAILAKPLADCVTVLCVEQRRSRHFKVCGILKGHATFKQIGLTSVVYAGGAPFARVVVLSLLF